MRRGMIGLLALLVCVVMGIGGGTEIEEQAFVLTLGMDREEDGAMRVSVIVPSGRTGESGGGSGGGGGGSGSGSSGASGNSYELMSCTAANYIDALLTLRSIVPRRLNFAQVVQVVVSETLAREETFVDTLRSVLGTEQIREATVLVVCRDKAWDFMDAQRQPLLGRRLSVAIQEALEDFEELGSISCPQLGEVVRMTQRAWNDMLVPYVSVAITGEEKKAEPGRALDLYPGEVRYAGTPNKVEYFGAAVFRDGRMAGALTAMEMQTLSFLMGGAQRVIFAADGVYYHLDRMRETHMEAKRADGGWRLRVDASIQAFALQGTTAPDAVREAFGREVLGVLSKLRALGSDPLGFEGNAVRAYPTLDAWAGVDWESAYQQAAIEVRLQVTAAAH
ncbi:hypothetical protein FACS1894196_1850 [Clostridia bacterium]|nr:hypothetical protein FACS1894196_1780 [Clostridia bacterium]GHU82856.1 hypothetical protein FACS1894196_1850 [Clostridia bacterium]